jgi:hypothetical protein
MGWVYWILNWCYGTLRGGTGREGGVGSAITYFSLWLNLDLYQCNKGYISNLTQAMIENAVHSPSTSYL